MLFCIVGHLVYNEYATTANFNLLFQDVLCMSVVKYDKFKIAKFLTCCMLSDNWCFSQSGNTRAVI